MAASWPETRTVAGTRASASPSIAPKGMLAGTPCPWGKVEAGVDVVWTGHRRRQCWALGHSGETLLSVDTVVGAGWGVRTGKGQICGLLSP